MILRPTDGPEDWSAFLAKPDLHWKPGRSAMETAYSWEAGFPREIAALFPGTELLQAIPEYKVPLPGGERASQNDVFALLRDDDGLIVCMVEAKRDEPFGPTLGEWLARQSDGKLDRLSAIASLLGLDSESLTPSLRYQLFHRTASAILTAQKFHAHRAAMVVQSFSPEHRWFEDFRAFCALFGLSPERNRPYEIHLPDGLSLTIAWASAPLRTEEIPR